MIDNSFYDSVLEYLKDYLVVDEDGKWCVEKMHYSGHYSDWKPIQYLDDAEIEQLEESIWEDFELEERFDDYDWEDFYETFDEAFYQLVEQNLGK
jgi:hypothetical protein